MHYSTALSLLALHYQAFVGSASPASGAAAPTTKGALVLLGSASPGGNDKNKKVDFVTYEVPNTHEIVDYHLKGAIDPTAMTRTVAAVNDVIDYYIFDHGDGFLQPDEDPYIFKGIYGVSFKVQSMPQELLSWSYVRGAAQGLKELLCQKGQYYQSDFNIFDSGDGLKGELVGQGRLSTSSSNNVTADGQYER